MYRLIRYAVVGSGAALAVFTGILLVPAAGSAAPTASPITLSPSTLDYHNQTITVSGTLTAVPVGTTVTISYTNASDQPASVETNAGPSGNYETTITGLEPVAQTITVSGGGASATANLAFAVDSVTITLNPLPAFVPLNSKVTLSGNVTYLSGGTSYPLAGDQLTITSPFANPQTVTTAADGTFIDQAYAYNLSDQQSWTVSSAATAYLDAATATATAGTQWPTQFELFRANLSTHGQLALDICLEGEAPLTNGTPLPGPITYQYAAAPHGPWKKLRVPKVVDNSYCPGTFSNTNNPSFPAAFKAPLANGYYRAVYRGDSTEAPAVSSVLHRWKYRTRITGFAVRPVTVPRGGTVTVSGKLRLLNRTWRADPHQKVTIGYRYHGKTYILRRLTTSSSGRFSGTVRIPHGAALLAVYNGDKTQFATGTKPIKVS